jgi:hypothetical protein
MSRADRVTCPTQSKSWFHRLGWSRGNPGAKIVNDAIEAHADLDLRLPEALPHYLYGEKEECRKVFERAGFDGDSMTYETRSVEWRLPTASYFFDAERDADVRTAGLLAHQPPERLEATRIAIENGVKQLARENEFVLPMAARVVAVSKQQSARPQRNMDL